MMVGGITTIATYMRMTFYIIQTQKAQTFLGGTTEQRIETRWSLLYVTVYKYSSNKINKTGISRQN